MFRYLFFGLHSSPKRQGGMCWRSKLAITEADRSDRSGPIIRVGLIFCVKSPIVTQFERDTSSPGYKYKGCGRLRVFLTTIEPKLFSLLNFSNLNIFQPLYCSLLVSTAFKGVLSGLPTSRQLYFFKLRRNPSRARGSKSSRVSASNRSDRLERPV